MLHVLFGFRQRLLNTPGPFQIDRGRYRQEDVSNHHKSRDHTLDDKIKTNDTRFLTSDLTVCGVQ